MTDDLRQTLRSPLSRRTVLLTGGLAAAAVSGLSGCTNYGGKPETATLTPIKTADIPVGSGRIFPDQQVVVTQPTAGAFKAFSSICTHNGCPVADVTDTINCNCHGSKFAIADGAVVNPPAPRPLPAKTVTVTGDTITVT